MKLSKFADSVDHIHRGQIETAKLREMLATPRAISFNEVGGRTKNYKIRGLESLQNSTAPQTANTDLFKVQMPPKTAGGPSKPSLPVALFTTTASVNEAE
jgi:hypothetical protein